MTLKGQIQDDMKTAMKSGDKDRLKVVRLIMAAIKQIEIDSRTELGDTAVLAVINKMVKQRRDSITQFVAGNRQDLADIEQAEIGVLEQYLPQQLEAAELDQIISRAIENTAAASIRDMGQVMAEVKEKAAGRADMAYVGKIVKAKLGS